MQPMIVTAALVGGELTRQDTPHLPLTSQEIAREALACVRVGAAIMHVHARDEKGEPRHRTDLFEKIVRDIKLECEANGVAVPIIQFSTGGSIGMTLTERMAPLALKPEMASLTTGTVNFGHEVFENSQKTMEEIAAALKEKKIAVELEIFDSGMIDNALALLRKGLLQEPLHFNFVLGVPGGLGGGVEDLIFLTRKIPAGSTWSVAGIGRHQLRLTTLALVLGGHVRVGLEDNIYYRKGELAQGNAPFIARLARIAVELDRPLASPDEARHLLGIK